MSADHLSCRRCRIRVLASAPAVDLLEARCPICGLALTPASAPSGVIGLRLFDLAPFTDGERPGETLAWPADDASIPPTIAGRRRPVRFHDRDVPGDGA